jgi:hypothetical protein
MSILKANSKVIEIHRAPNFIQQANPESEVKEYFDMAFKAIGSYYKEFGSVVATGLTRKEELDLMPELIGGIDPKDSHLFRGAVQTYFKNINFKVPSEGVKLEIGLETSNEAPPDSIENAPIKLRDYIIYRWLLEHPQVAKSKEEAERYQHMKFYIEDKVAINLVKTKLREEEDKAQEAYLKVKKDPRKVEMLLTLMGIDTRSMNDDTILLQAKSTVSLDAESSDTANMERFKRFVAIYSDKDLTLKYDILDMIRYGILERLKSKILDNATKETIGDNLREAVVFFQDKGNSKTVNTYYAKLDNLASNRRVKHKSPWLDELKDPTGSTPAGASPNDPPSIPEL